MHVCEFADGVQVHPKKASHVSSFMNISTACQAYFRTQGSAGRAEAGTGYPGKD